MSDKNFAIGEEFLEYDPATESNATIIEQVDHIKDTSQLSAALLLIILLIICAKLAHDFLNNLF